MSAVLALYRGVGSAAVAAGVPGWVLRGRPEELRERLGHGDPLTPGAVWVHGASLGEMRAAEALLGELRKRGIGPLALSATTRTGRERAAGIAPDVGPVFLPLDAPAPVARFLDRLRPRTAVLLETELWPVLLADLTRRDVPWAMASARMSRRGARRLRPIRGTFRRLLAPVTAVAARTGADAERFEELGVPAARLRVTGDLKDDLRVAEWTPPPVFPTWVAACTRPGEESDVLATLPAVAARVPRGRLLLAPRHPERFEEVAGLVQRAGLPMTRWPEAGPDPSEGWTVTLVDRMGVLDEVYRQGTCAFVGGSLRPFGGHSPLEAAAAGRVVLVGPHTANCEAAVRALIHGQGALRVRSTGELAAAVGDLLAGPERAVAAGHAAHTVARGLGGVAARTVDFLRERGALPAPETAP